MGENKRDIEVDTMRRRACIPVMELSNVIGVSYSSLNQRIGGFCKWKHGEREKIIEYIKEKGGQNEIDMRKE